MVSNASYVGVFVLFVAVSFSWILLDRLSGDDVVSFVFFFRNELFVFFFHL